MSDYTFKDMTDRFISCLDCKYNTKKWYEMPCDDCCPAHCGYTDRDWDAYYEAMDIVQETQERRTG